MVGSYASISSPRNLVGKEYLGLGLAIPHLNIFWSFEPDTSTKNCRTHIRLGIFTTCEFKLVSFYF